MTPNPKHLSYPPNYSYVTAPPAEQIDAALSELIQRLDQLYDNSDPGHTAEELRRCTRLVHTIRRLSKLPKE